MMNFKDAFRYQNFLGELFGNVYNYITSKFNLVNITETHLKSKHNSDAEDEVVDATPASKLDIDVDKMVDLLIAVLDEKEKMGIAISRAKAAHSVEIDATASHNKFRQRAISALQYMSAVKPSKDKVRGSDYKFNNEGNQVSYSYDIERTISLDFDKTKVKDIIHQLSEKSNDASNAIEKALLDDVVDFEPTFDINDKFDDIVEVWAAKSKDSSENM